MPAAKNDWCGLHQVLRKNSGSSDFLVGNDQSQIEIWIFPKAAVHRCKAETLWKRRKRRRMHLGDIVGHSGTSVSRSNLSTAPNESSNRRWLLDRAPEPFLRARRSSPAQIQASVPPPDRIQRGARS